MHSPAAFFCVYLARLRARSRFQWSRHNFEPGAYGFPQLRQSPAACRSAINFAVRVMVPLVYREAFVVG